MSAQMCGVQHTRKNLIIIKLWIVNINNYIFKQAQDNVFILQHQDQRSELVLVEKTRRYVSKGRHSYSLISFFDYFLT